MNSVRLKKCGIKTGDEENHVLLNIDRIVRSNRKLQRMKEIWFGREFLEGFKDTKDVNGEPARLVLTTSMSYSIVALYLISIINIARRNLIVERVC